MSDPDPYRTNPNGMTGPNDVGEVFLVEYPSYKDSAFEKLAKIMKEYSLAPTGERTLTITHVFLAELYADPNFQRFTMFDHVLQRHQIFGCTLVVKD